MPLLRRLLLSAVVVVTASALCVCAALASPLVAKSKHPRLTIVHRALAPVARLAPGDSAQRTVELRYRGRGRFGAVVLRLKGLNHSPLGAGLRLKLERCSKAWTKKPGARTFVCRGKRRLVLATSPVSRTQAFPLKHLSARAGHTDHLRLTLALPLWSGNELQHRLGRLIYTFTGAAR
jgi:hypothetical protein